MITFCYCLLIWLYWNIAMCCWTKANPWWDSKHTFASITYSFKLCLTKIWNWDRKDNKTGSTVTQLLWSRAEPCAWKGLKIGLPLGCSPLEILNLWAQGPIFSLCTELHELCCHPWWHTSPSWPTVFPVQFSSYQLQPKHSNKPPGQPPAKVREPSASLIDQTELLKGCKWKQSFLLNQFLN